MYERLFKGLAFGMGLGGGVILCMIAPYCLIRWMWGRDEKERKKAREERERCKQMDRFYDET